MVPLKLISLLGLALLGSALGACQSERTAQDSLPDSLAPNVELLNLGDRLFKQGKYHEAKQAYARAVNANGPDHAYVEACAQVARMESLQGNLQEGRPWLELGMTRASRKEPLGWSRMQMVLGIFEREAGDRAAAVKRFQELYAYDLKHELYDRAIDVAHHVVLASDDFEQQMEWTQRGIEAAEQGGLQGWLAVLWNNKGAACEDQGRWEDAYIAYTKARDYHYEVGDKRRMLIADWALARAERRSGRVDEGRERSEDAYARAVERYGAEPSPQNAEWVGYLRWELAEHDALADQSVAAADGLREARAKLVEAGIESWGDFGQTELARLDARLEELAGAGS